MSGKIVREYGTPTPPLVKAVYPNVSNIRFLTVKREDCGITFRAEAQGLTAYNVALTPEMVLELIADLRQMVDQSVQ